MKIVIVGGHLSPALALIEELKKKKTCEIYWVGRKYAMEGKKIVSFEYEVISKIGIPFYCLTAGRLQRKLTSRTILALLKIPVGFLQSFYFLLKIKPDLIVSFGGYLGLPVIFTGWLLSIPSVLHEQTVTSGLSNRLASIFVKKVAISFATSALDFPTGKTVLTGIPLRRAFLSKKNGKMHKKSTPLVFITGGNQGSQLINYEIQKILTKLLSKSRVVHQTGVLDFEKFSLIKSKLPPQLRKNYEIFANLSPDQMAAVMAMADVVISRAGANTVAEIAALGIPAILIPIPWSEKNEQEKNARLLEATGLARVMDQQRLDSKTLLVNIDYFLENGVSSVVVKRARKLIKRDAAARLADLIFEIARK